VEELRAPVDFSLKIILHARAGNTRHWAGDCFLA
jgi:hypothetical protein